MDPTHLTPEAHRSGRNGGINGYQRRPSASPGMGARTDADRGPRKLILCFDGTGNKFHGNDSDSNILKIFRCLDREASDQYHYYQPGIGTYVVSQSLSHTGLTARIKSWYQKGKDSAVGSSFDHHVVGGYRFLMRFYNPGDEIYFFGFSRGAYVARFLAEMLDYVGLLSHGNEEMVSFAWKAFSRWQSRQTDDSPESIEQRREMYQFMKGFRETFSRPVKRIRFLGLFDTVNSVPRFETAWMQRSKFPYTARSSAKVIRHCVSIDERRAKFRQDLIYQGAEAKKKAHEEGHHHHLPVPEFIHEKYRARRKSHAPQGQGLAARGRAPTEKAFRPHSRSRSRATNRDSSRGSGRYQSGYETDDSDDDDQDIDEVWFAGGHGDVGGGWEVPADRKSASHIPLAYMIREAARAGLEFDPNTLIDMGVSHAFEEEVEDAEDEEERMHDAQSQPDSDVPDIRIEMPSPNPINGNNNNNEKSAPVNGQPKKKTESQKIFHEILEKAHVARIHDSLEFSSGLGRPQVLSWKIMEYMPFRRMDLQPDGSWKPINWPLPCGETRDMPSKARVHGSVIRRMQKDESYRPGNLIVGGGGRGMRVAPKEYGWGEWECVAEPGDPLGELWVKKDSPRIDK